MTTSKKTSAKTDLLVGAAIVLTATVLHQASELMPPPDGFKVEQCGTSKNLVPVTKKAAC
jgi:hypothetical protein